jgi:hypothetical protein
LNPAVIQSRYVPQLLIVDAQQLNQQLKLLALIEALLGYV